MTKLEELKSRHAELLKQIKDESAAWFKQESAGLFAKYPKMESFQWRQYTPYFNDGDECVFSVHGDCPEINETDEYDCQDEALKAAYAEVKALIQGIDEPTMKEMFGDHCEVIATREGVKAEDYHHD